MYKERSSYNMRICLLGASGSIGQQTIDVVKKHIDDFDIVGISIGKRTRKIPAILGHFSSITAICVQEEKAAKRLNKRYPKVKFFFGDKGLEDLIDACPCDMVVNALVGFVGLRPTIHALEKDKIVALANKESLVVGGELVNDLLDKGHGKLYPIDSEHVALRKCLSVSDNEVEKLIITASGGAFRKLSREELGSVRAADALKHPTWKMGNKITIDCATMVNKTFEIIEAYYLFGYKTNQIDVLLHDESMIHSLVKYKDGTYRLDLGKPDMRIPIVYALYQGAYPFKTYLVEDYHVFDQYHFRDFDINRYPIVRYAKKVIDQKGTYGAVLNAVNEVAVYAFLKDEIPFLAIEEIITHFMEEHKNIKHPTLKDIVDIDKRYRVLTRLYIEERYK